MTEPTTTTLTSYIINGYGADFHPGGDTNLIQLTYANLDFTPSASDSYKSTSGDILKVYVDGIRIYRAHDETFASGSGFLEDGDNVNGQKLNSKELDKNGDGLTWSDTNDNVWTIDTSHKTVTLNISNVHATNLYHNNALTTDDPAGSQLPTRGQQVKFTSGTSIIELRRAVQDLKTPAIDFSNASILTEQDLDNSAKNVFHISQQAVLSTEDAMLYDSGTGTYKATQPGSDTAKRISSVATPVNDNDATNKAYVDAGTNVPTVASNIDSVNTVATNIANVNKVGVIDANVTKVANIDANVTKVANIDTNVTKVVAIGTDGANVTKVANIDANVTKVADIDANVTKVANIDANVTKVANIDANVTKVADIDANVTKVANIDSNVTTVAGLGTNGAHVTTVATNNANVTTVAQQIADINNYADTYFGTDSTSDGPSGSFTAGDLYFSTYNSENKLKVYNGSAWQNATSAVEGVATITEWNGSTSTAVNGTNKWFAFTHDVGIEIVWLNGVRLIQGTDYLSVNAGDSSDNMVSGTASHLYFATPPVSGDVLSAMAFGTVELQIAVPKSGGTFTGAISGTDLTLSGDLTVNGTTTTLDTAVQNVDKLEVGASSTDYGAKINQSSTGNILQLQDNGTDVMVVADGGKVGIGTNAPGEALHIKTTADADYGIKVENDDTQAFCKVQSSGNALYGGNAGVNIVSGGSFATAMHIDSSGNVGIGTDTPQALVVSKEASNIVEAINFVAEAYGDSGDTCGYYFASHTGVDEPNRKAAILLKKTGDFGIGDLHFVLDSNADDASISQANDTKMTIKSSGNVGISTDSPTSSYGTTLEVYSGNDPTFKLNDGGDYKAYLKLGGNDLEIRGSSGAMEFYNGGDNDGESTTLRMIIASNGNIGVSGNSTAIYTASDKRLKENVKNLSSCLDKINQMQGVEFNWIPGFADEDENKINYGLIAQDVNEIDPNLVNSFVFQPLEVGDLTIDKPLTVNTKYIIPILIEAVKELSAKVTALENA